VTIFFTFWGLFPLVRNEKGITGQVWMQKMLSVMNRGGTSHLPLSKLLTHRFTLDQAEHAYKLFDTQTTGKGIFLPS